MCLKSVSTQATRSNEFNYLFKHKLPQDWLNLQYTFIMATPQDIRSVLDAYSHLIGETFIGKFQRTMTMGLTSDGSGRTGERLMISIEESSSDLETKLQKIGDEYETKIWKGFVWSDNRSCFLLFIGESDIGDRDVELTEGTSYKFEITEVNEFGQGLEWKKPQDYIWKLGMNISLKVTIQPKPRPPSWLSD